MHHDPGLIDSLRNARHVVVLTGAGISAESGIPTFRDKQTGLWERFDAMELATPEAFARDPALVWGWYEWRRAAVLRAEPNSGHRSIAALAARVPRLTLVTQNVDDLHERAGSRGVLHLHGELAQPYCEGCRRPHAQTAPEPPGAGRRIEPPRCADCGARVRPGVVWFGESLPTEPWRAAVGATRAADLYFCIGTSSLVQPAASLTELAARGGALTVQVNPNATEVESLVAINYRGAAGVVLPDLMHAAYCASRSAQCSLPRSPR